MQDRSPHAAASGRSPGRISFSAFDRLRIIDGEVEGLTIVKRCPTQWTVGEERGRGRHSVVFDAVGSDDKKYVIKKISINYIDFGQPKEHSLSQFAKEVYYNVKLSELGIAPDVFDWGMCAEEPSYFYMVSAAVDETLLEHMQKHGISESIVLRATQKIMRMCRDGVGHGDLHSNNIMVDDDGEVYIIDFGEAVDFDSSDWAHEAAVMWIDLFADEFHYDPTWEVPSAQDAASVVQRIYPGFASAIYKYAPRLAPARNSHGAGLTSAFASCVTCGSVAHNMCSGCSRATYCSVSCQCADWQQGHQDACSRQ